MGKKIPKDKILIVQCHNCGHRFKARTAKPKGGERQCSNCRSRNTTEYLTDKDIQTVMGGTPFQDELIQSAAVATMNLMESANVEKQRFYDEVGEDVDKMLFDVGNVGLNRENKEVSSYTEYKPPITKDIPKHMPKITGDYNMSEQDEEMSTVRKKTNAYLKNFLDPNFLAKIQMADRYMDLQNERSKKMLLEEKKSRLKEEMEYERVRQMHDKMMPRATKGGSGTGGGVTPAMLTVMNEKDKQGLASMNQDQMRNYAIMKALEDNPQAALFLATMQGQNQGQQRDGVEKASDIVASMAAMYEAMKPKDGGSGGTSPWLALVEYMKDSSLAQQNNSMQYLTALITLMQTQSAKERELQNAILQTQIDQMRNDSMSRGGGKQEIIDMINAFSLIQEKLGGFGGKKNPEEKKWEVIGDMIGGATEMLGQTLVQPAAEAMSERIKNPPPPPPMMPGMPMPGMPMPGMPGFPPPTVTINPGSGRVTTPHNVQAVTPMPTADIEPSAMEVRNQVTGLGQPFDPNDLKSKEYYRRFLS